VANVAAGIAYRTPKGAANAKQQRLVACPKGYKWEQNDGGIMIGWENPNNSD